jgi:hypothetical protein
MPPPKGKIPTICGRRSPKGMFFYSGRMKSWPALSCCFPKQVMIVRPSPAPANRLLIASRWRYTDSSCPSSPHRRPETGVSCPGKTKIRLDCVSENKALQSFYSGMGYVVRPSPAPANRLLIASRWRYTDSSCPSSPHRRLSHPLASGRVEPVERPSRRGRYPQYAGGDRPRVCFFIQAE